MKKKEKRGDKFYVWLAIRFYGGENFLLEAAGGGARLWFVPKFSSDRRRKSACFTRLVVRRNFTQEAKIDPPVGMWKFRKIPQCCSNQNIFPSPHSPGGRIFLPCRWKLPYIKFDRAEKKSNKKSSVLVLHGVVEKKVWKKAALAKKKFSFTSLRWEGESKERQKIDIYQTVAERLADWLTDRTEKRLTERDGRTIPYSSYFGSGGWVARIGQWTTTEWPPAIRLRRLTRSTWSRRCPPRTRNTRPAAVTTTRISWCWCRSRMNTVSNARLGAKL